MKRAAEVVAECFDDGWFRYYFGPGTILVPAPRSSPIAQGALWPASRIADALVTQGLADGARPYVLRVRSIPKQAFSPRGERSTLTAHLRSIRVDRELIHHARLTVVDDIVTKGATLYSCVKTLAEAFPGAAVNGFALIRTRGFDDVAALKEPFQGTIYYKPAIDSTDRGD